MPILKRFNDCRIAMYPRDHAPPHVHVEFRDGDRCTVEIETLAMAGRARPKAKLADALVWIAENRSTLHRCWKEIVS